MASKESRIGRCPAYVDVRRHAYKITSPESSTDIKVVPSGLLRKTMWEQSPQLQQDKGNYSGSMSRNIISIQSEEDWEQWRITLTTCWTENAAQRLYKTGLYFLKEISIFSSCFNYLHIFYKYSYNQKYSTPKRF